MNLPKVQQLILDRLKGDIIGIHISIVPEWLAKLHGIAPHSTSYWYLTDNYKICSSRAIEYLIKKGLVKIRKSHSNIICPDRIIEELKQD